MRRPRRILGGTGVACRSGIRATSRRTRTGPVRHPVGAAQDERALDRGGEPLEPRPDVDRGVASLIGMSPSCWRGGSRRAALPFDRADSRARAAPSGGLATPRSVTMADTRRAGVTSKAGLAAGVPGGATGASVRRGHLGRVSLLDRISDPVAVARSTVDIGAAT